MRNDIQIKTEMCGVRAITYRCHELGILGRLGLLWQQHTVCRINVQRSQHAKILPEPSAGDPAFSHRQTIDIWRAKVE